MIDPFDVFKTRKLRFFEGLLSFYRGTGDLTSALAYLENRLGSTPEGMAAGQIGRALEGGQSLSEAFSQAMTSLSPVEGGLLEVGELSGNLEQSLSTVVEEIHRERRWKQDLAARLAYPVLVLHLAGIVFTYIQSVFSGWTWIWPLGYFGLCYGITLGLWVFFRKSRTDPGIQGLLLRLPLLGPLSRHRLCSRFSSSLCMLYGAGIPIARALEIVADTLGPAKEGILQAAAAARQGEPLSLHIPSILSDPLLNDAIILGEKSGNLSEELARARIFYEDQADRSLRLVTRTAGGALFAVAAATVLYLAITVWSHYLSLASF